MTQLPSCVFLTSGASAPSSLSSETAPPPKSPEHSGGAAARTGVLPAVVLSCQGAPEGDLNLVRSLGEQGVPVIVVSEYAQPPARLSRYCREFIQVPMFGQDPQSLARVLQQLADRYGRPLPVFPSADPDLVTLSALQRADPGCFTTTLADPALVAVLVDKARFSALAAEVGLPVPRTWVPSTMRDLQAIVPHVRWPVMLKPAHAMAWRHPSLSLTLRRAKALRVENEADLLQLCQEIEQHEGLAVVVQEYVPGDDASHYDVHAYVNRQGRPLATYCGRKWRIYPPHAGAGSLVESVDQPQLEALALDLLRRIGYRGIANLNFKRHEVTGEFLLLEINARISQWNILPTRSGVNVAWLAYQDVCGLPAASVSTRRNGLWYVNGKKDLLAVRAYQRTGEWPWGAYWRSVLRWAMVHQTLSVTDPMPALRLTGRWLAVKMRLRSPD